MDEYPFWRVPTRVKSSYVYGFNDVTLNAQRQRLYVRIKSWSAFLLKNIYISYPITVVGGAQTNPDLSFEVTDLGRNYPLQGDPIFVPSFTGPSNFGSFPGGGSYDYVVAANGRLEIIITGQAGGAPANVSVSLHGMHERWRY